MILVIDNYDSFTYNLVQYLGELGAEPTVRRNDAVTMDEIRASGPQPHRHLARAGHPRRWRHLTRRHPRAFMRQRPSSASAWATSASPPPLAAGSIARRA